MIGEVEGVSEGAIFRDRQALHDAGIHRGIQQGIGGGGESIVLSGGYVDDRDDGDVVLYTGQGGRDPNSGRQIADQQLTRGNLLLAKHFNEGNPVRVTRGSRLDSNHAPGSGYRYDGLYRIDDFWHERGQDGFLVYRYRLVRIRASDVVQVSSLPTPQPATHIGPEGNLAPAKSTVYTTRVIRNSAVVNHVKELYQHRCQISGVVLETPFGRYAEGCHIKPVGSPHDGPDVVGNVLCLSPNMHVLFDKGAIAIADDLTLLGIGGKLERHPDHQLSMDYISYHREHIYQSRPERLT
jgi:putative restriction endonuclease